MTPFERVEKVLTCLRFFVILQENSEVLITQP